MSWEAIGAIGEVVGALAVVCTLIYLAVQIKQNTAKTRVQIRQAISDAQSANINLRATDPHIVRIVIKSRKEEVLNEEELARLQFHLDATLRQFKNIHAQYLAGYFPESEWKSIHAGLAGTMTVGPSVTIWDRYMRHTYNEEFRKVLDDIVIDYPRKPIGDA